MNRRKIEERKKKERRGKGFYPALEHEFASVSCEAATRTRSHEVAGRFGRSLPSTLLHRFLTFALVIFLLSACSYSYIPLVPEARTPTPRINVQGSAGLARDGEGLRLRVRLNNIPEADWLAVQWFDPQNRQVASDSTWITPADESETRTLYLPGSVSLSAGTWRAVLFYQGAVVRQFSATLEAKPS